MRLPKFKKFQIPKTKFQKRVSYHPEQPERSVDGRLASINLQISRFTRNYKFGFMNILPFFVLYSLNLINLNLHYATCKNTQKGFIRLTKKTLTTYLIIFIALSGTGIFYLFNPFSVKKTEAAWFNEDWNYRKPITFTHNANVSNTYVQLNVVDTTAAPEQYQSDCGDVRFTDASGNLLRYYYDSGAGACDTNSTDFDVLIPSIINGINLIYMYYGNPGVVNGTETSTLATLGFAETTPSGGAATVGSEAKSEIPLGHWKFDDGQGSAAQDSTVNNVDGTLTNTTWKTEDLCVSGKCVAYDGTSDYVSMGNNSAYNFTSSGFTLETWVYPTSVGANDLIFSRGSFIADGWYLQFDSGGTRTVQFVSNQVLAAQVVTGTTAVPLNTWTHIVFTRSGTTGTIYINGKAESSYTNLQSITNPATSTRNLYLNTDDALTASSGFAGRMDNTRIFNYARSAAQIRADYNARANPEALSANLGSLDQPGALSNGLVGYWKMDESSWTSNCSTEEVLDASGNSNHGESCPNGAANDPVAGKFGNAGNFDGSNDYVLVDNDTSLNPTTFTVAFWLYKPTEASDIDFIVNKRNLGGQNSGWAVVFDDSVSNKKVYMGVYDSNGNQFHTNGQGNSFPTTTWRHFAFTFDGTQIRGFENGVQVSTTSFTGTFATSSDPIYFGSYGGTSCCWPNITIDETRFYNRALSNSEVSQLYNWAPGPLGYWKMDDTVSGDSQTIVDSSGFANSGTTENGGNATGMNCQASGKFGGGCEFDGTDDYISGSISGNPITSSFTISTWVKTTLASTQQNLVGLGISGGNRENIIINGTNNFACQNTSTTATSTTTLSLNTWYYVTCTNDGTNMYIFVNGVRESSNTAITLSTNNYALGSSLNSPGSLVLKGTQDDVKIYNYVRSQSQIIQDMNAGHPAPGSPVGSALINMKFEEGSPNRCSGGTNDVCNSGNLGTTADGTYNGATPATATSGWSQGGKVGKAVNFDGAGSADDEINLGSATAIDDIPTNGMTLSAWIYPRTTGENSRSRVFDKTTATDATNGWHLVVDSSVVTNSLQLVSDCDPGVGTDLAVRSVANSITLNTWQHVSATWDGSCTATNVKLYVNGREVQYNTQQNGSSTRQSDATSSLRIGNDSTGARTFDGLIDEAKIYSGILTADQIKADMNQGSAQQLGALGDNTNYEKNAANQEYCVPGDSTSCAAPIGRWDFEEGSGSTSYDTSGNGFNGTNNNTTYETGSTLIGGTAQDFNGSSSYVTVSDNNTLDLTTNLSLSAWVKVDTFPTAGNYGQIVGKGYDGSANEPYFLRFFNSGGTQQLRVGAFISGGDYGVNWNHDLVTGKWYHIEGTFDGTTWILYVNGVLKASNPGAITLVNVARPLIIGALDSNGSITRHIDGKIDNVRIFNYTRTSSQVAWDYNKGKPLAHWRMDECQGTTLNDSSGNAHTGTWAGSGGSNTATGTCISGNSAHAWYNGVTGKRNYSLNFDGTDDQVTTPDHNNFDFNYNTPFSVSAWIRPSFARGAAETFSITQKLELDTPFPGWAFDVSWDTIANPDKAILRLVLIKDLATTFEYDLIEGSTDLQNSSWYHVVAVYDGSFTASNYKLYVNGRSDSFTVGSDTLGSGDAITNNEALYIGNNVFGTDPFQGNIDDVKIFNFAVTESQVKTLFNDGAVNYSPSTGAP